MKVLNQVPSLADIEAAHRRIQPWIHYTPVLKCKSINELSGCSIFFKCENFQKVGAFKMRGASNAILSLEEEQLSKGIATHSSGNHAQAVALAAKNVGAKAYIVMPKNAPKVKVAAVKGYEAEVIFCEANIAARETTLNKVVEDTGATFIHPFDNYRVIAGQATAALELLEEIERLDVLMAPVGGGGLISGTALTTHYLSPHTKIIAGEPKGADDAYRSVKAGKIIPSVNPQTIADGLLTSLSDKTFSIIREHVSEIITVSDEEIIEAMRLIWERMKILIEPSSAVPLAALIQQKNRFVDQRIGIILTGGNIDLDKLPF